MIASYCKLCGNNPAVEDDSDKLCSRCRCVVEGPMAEAWRRWNELSEEQTRCCGRISSDIGFDRKDTAEVTLTTCLSFHGKYMDGSYRKTSVEYGVNFFPDAAGTYYLRDFGNSADSVDYGDLFSYEDPDFWEKLEYQRSQAPVEAYNDGLKSCGACGNHYYGAWRAHRPYCGH